jgi:hypothetical protein
MNQGQIKKPAISIDEATDGGRQVLLRPQDNDLFIQTGQQVISACRLGISIEVWLKEMKSMFESVAKWAEKRKDVIEGCYSVPRNSQMVLFFVTTSDQFDFELAEQLVELNTHLLTEFNIGMVEVQQIPFKEADRFIDTEAARRIYGSNPESHRPVEA